ncbi:MAG: radical SAM protein, partial [Clostridia bacterium]
VLTNNYLSKSKLPVSDYVINPYIGCLHGCKYCYACFMKRFTHHPEPWGDFIDAKFCDKPINLKTIKGSSVVLSSVTDCYNIAEEKYGITRRILEQLVDSECSVTVVTKSALVLRDIDVLKQINNLTVAISINTLDENFKNDMDKASSISERLRALKVLRDNGIENALFMSPIFPAITEFKSIIEASRNFVDTYWFENLNLRGSFRTTILDYVKEKYPNVYPLYKEIYIDKDRTYWESLAEEINQYCEQEDINYINYFYHEQIRKP